MEKTNPLLPFAFDSSRSSTSENPLSTQPRDRFSRDRDAGGTQFHTRVSSVDEQGFRVPLSPVRSTNKRRGHRLDDDFDESDADETKKIKMMSSYEASSSSSFRFPSSESSSFIAHQHNIPSSPPMYVQNSSMVQSSDDFEDTTFIMPSSPPMFANTQETEVGFGTQRTEVGEPLSDSRGCSYPAPSSDGLIPLDLDQFGRVHATQPSSKQDSELDNGMEVDQEEVQRKFREAVNAMFDNQESTLTFESYALESIPSEIADLNDLTIVSDGEISPASLSIYLSGNRISTLAPCIFDVTGISVLSLRYNKIRRIPGAIERLTNLTYLSVANNRIAYFPHNILKLKRIETLTIRPNPLVEPTTEIAIPMESHQSSQPGRILKYVGKLKWHTDGISSEQRPNSAVTRGLSVRMLRSVTTHLGDMDEDADDPFWNPKEEEEPQESEMVYSVPRLQELALREISKYKISASEIKNWKRNILSHLKKKTFDALINGSNGETCGTCEHNIVVPVAEVMEWWDFSQVQNMPVQRKFCSTRCALLWRDTMVPHGTLTQ